MKRFLTQREAEKCEQAREPVCKCRCQGAKHGANRAVVSGGDFSLLPEDDPHYRPSMNRKQILKFLADAHYRVLIGDNFHSMEDAGYQARYEALKILSDAREAVGMRLQEVVSALESPCAGCGKQPQVCICD